MIPLDQSFFALRFFDKADGLMQLQPALRLVAVDLLHIELAHEVDRLGGQHLARHHDREARRIGNDEIGRDEIRPVLQPLVDLRRRAAERTRSPPRHRRRRRRCACRPRCVPGPGIAAEGLVEAAEVRQVRHVVHQALHARLERRLRALAAILQPRLDLVADLDQHADQMRHVAARVVDVGLEQHRVARGLVDLDVVLVGEHSLELGAVDTRQCRTPASCASGRDRTRPRASP